MKPENVKIDWVEIPGGEFLMGLSKKQLKYLQRNIQMSQKLFQDEDLPSETTQRVVHMDTFWISRFPITYGQYSEFVASGHPYADPLGIRELPNFHEYPMNNPEPVIWHSAVAFCAWIGARLPTAAEWEKAARGTDGQLWPWGDRWNAGGIKAQHRGNFSTAQEAPRPLGWITTPVETYPEGTSPYGVYDMMGNVREWTMTFEYDQKSRSEVPVVKGSTAKDWPKPDWVTHRVTRHRKGSLIPHLSPEHTGFRPVIDRWHKQYWPGFKSDPKMAGDASEYLYGYKQSQS